MTVDASPSPPLPWRSRLSRDAIARVAWQQRVGEWTAEVVQALHGAGIRPVLLKGPVTARWLYAQDTSQRLYVDADLLVEPARVDRAYGVLAALGFEAREHPVLTADEHHARPFTRRRDGAKIDLHRTFHGMEAIPAGVVWRVITRHLEPFEVGGASVAAPDLTLRTLMVALHLGAVDSDQAKTWQDLERALSQVSLQDWRAALELARELGIEPELAARLRRLPAGVRIADQLGVTTSGSRYYALVGAVDRGEVPGSVLAVHRFLSGTDVAQTLLYLARKLIPPEEQLHRDYPRLAGAGSVGIAAARVLRPLRVLRRLPGAVRAFRRTS